MSPIPLTIFFLAILILPFVFGEVIARALKAKDLSMRISVTLLAILLGAAPFTYRMIAGKPLSEAIRLGIDLAGGTNLVYKVDVAAAKESGKEISKQSMDSLVGSINKRINAGGVEEVTVRKVGTDSIEVIVPGVVSDDVEQIKRRITNLGELEFAILADQASDGILISSARQSNITRDVLNGDRLVAQWLTVGKISSGPNKGKQKEINPSPQAQLVTRTATVLDNEGNPQPVTQYLVKIEPKNQRVTGQYLTRAAPQIGHNGGKVVGFNFNRAGAYRFSILTSNNRPAKDGKQRHLAVLLNGEIQSAPTINETISSSGQISGDFTTQEIKELVDVLNAGALKLPLISEPVNEFSISPLLGVDVREKGTTALMAAGIVVLVFMLAYYWFAGIVADVCLIINIVLVLGAMVLIQATFTLPGLAGLVLTIGMAVDANVLIFERIREELHKGSSLRMSIHNGFSRAFTTIVDANLTTLLTAVILYYIGTDQVKGFAVTLFIGIVMGMFSALFIGRLIFDLFERKRWIKSLPMASIVGHTNFHFMKHRYFAFGLSLLLIVSGLVAVFSRGQDNLDIDFTGGSMLTFKFEDQPEVDEIKPLLATNLGSNITLERLEIPKTDGTKTSIDYFFRLRTTDGNVKDVRNKIEKSFEGSTHKLTHITVTPSKITPYLKDAAVPAAKGSIVLNQNDKTRFEGGNQFTMAFSGELSIDTAKQYLREAFEATAKSEIDLVTLLDFEGTAGSGVPVKKEAKDDAKDKDGTKVVSKGSSSKRFSEITVLAVKSLETNTLEGALQSMQATMANTPIFEGVNTFDTSVASETQNNAILAMLLSLLAIIGYIWFRFESVTFGLAAVAALVHDILCVLGFVAFASLLSGSGIGQALGFIDFKINLPMIAAFLTIVGYSLNDTIVVFDRIREVRGKSPKLTPDMVDTSLNQTLSRTLLTSITTLIVVVILYGFGGEGIHGFAFCLVMGILVGTYSSIYVASPVLVWLMSEPTGSTADAKQPKKANA